MSPQAPALAQKLKRKLDGQLSFTGDARYETARTVRNAMIDRHPAAIVHCTGVDDVTRAIQAAQENGLEISIRGAGHNIAGTAVCEGGLMIDLSGMKDARIDKDVVSEPRTESTWARVGTSPSRTSPASPGRESSSRRRSRTLPSGAYVNFMTADESERVKAAYGPNYERLAHIKKQYDPKNFFHANQNIRP